MTNGSYLDSDIIPDSTPTPHQLRVLSHLMNHDIKMGYKDDQSISKLYAKKNKLSVHHLKLINNNKGMTSSLSTKNVVLRRLKSQKETAMKRKQSGSQFQGTSRMKGKSKVIDHAHQLGHDCKRQIARDVEKKNPTASSGTIKHKTDVAAHIMQASIAAKQSKKNTTKGTHIAASSLRRVCYVHFGATQSVTDHDLGSFSIDPAFVTDIAAMAFILVLYKTCKSRGSSTDKDDIAKIAITLIYQTLCGSVKDKDRTHFEQLYCSNMYAILHNGSSVLAKVPKCNKINPKDNATIHNIQKELAKLDGKGTVSIATADSINKIIDTKVLRSKSTKHAFTKAMASPPERGQELGEELREELLNAMTSPERERERLRNRERYQEIISQERERERLLNRERYPAMASPPETPQELDQAMTSQERLAVRYRNHQRA